MPLSQPYHRTAEPPTDPPCSEHYEANVEAEYRRNRHLEALEAIDTLVNHLEELGGWEQVIVRPDAFEGSSWNGNFEEAQDE